jgi:hypothetical protein
VGRARCLEPTKQAWFDPCLLCETHQIDIQDYSLVQAIRSCVVDGSHLLALGNEQGLQVRGVGPSQAAPSPARASNPTRCCGTSAVAPMALSAILAPPVALKGPSGSLRLATNAAC